MIDLLFIFAKKKMWEWIREIDEAKILSSVKVAGNYVMHGEAFERDYKKEYRMPKHFFLLHHTQKTVLKSLCLVSQKNNERNLITTQGKRN